MKIYTSHEKEKLNEYTSEGSVKLKIEFAANFLNGLEKSTLFLALSPNKKIVYVYGKEYIQEFIDNLVDFTAKFEYNALNIKQFRSKILKGILEKNYIKGTLFN